MVMLFDEKNLHIFSEGAKPAKAADSRLLSHFSTHRNDTPYKTPETQPKAHTEEIDVELLTAEAVRILQANGGEMVQKTFFDRLQFRGYPWKQASPILRVDTERFRFMGMYVKLKTLDYGVGFPIIFLGARRLGPQIWGLRAQSTSSPPRGRSGQPGQPLDRSKDGAAVGKR